MFKAHYPQEIPKSPSLVSSLKLGDHTLEPQEGAIGLSQYHGKYITMTDLGRVTCRAMVSTLILNTTLTPAERECPVDIINFLMFGSSTDDARILQRYRHFL